MNAGKQLAILLAASALVSSCRQLQAPEVVTDYDFRPRPPLPDPQFLTGEILPIASCAAAETYVEDRVVELMNAQLDERILAMSTYKRGRIRAQASTVPAEDGAAAPAPTATRTNVQVQGIEEGDFVKNDDAHLYQIVGKDLRIVRTWPAEEMAEVAVLPLRGLPTALFLDEATRRLLVLSAGDGERWNETDVDVIDVADPTAPRSLGTRTFAGRMASARRDGAILRLVTQAELPMPEGLQYDQTEAHFWYLPEAVRVAGFQRLREPNEKLIRAQPAEFWLGAAVVAAGCAKIYAPSVAAGLGRTYVHTVDLATEVADEQILLARVNHAYASHEALYLTTGYIWWDALARESDFTFIHKFATSGAQTGYVGSGGVKGTVLNSFAMDEFEGKLRVATTVSSMERSPTARVSVLEAKDGALVTIGATPDLVENERIYAARFHGPVGYVVTFRNVDPLFVLDLSDPTAPRVVSELKIPGYSSYIHLLADGRLLTLGMDADVSTGRVQGMKLSLFDVSTAGAPREVDALKLNGDFWATSAAESDHHAFTFEPEKGLLALPFVGGGSVGVRVFKVDPGLGIEEIGLLDTADIAGYGNVARSIFAGDYVYAIAYGGVRSAHVTALGQPLATARYPAPLPLPGFRE